jgi:D-erythronate 2-dehydrogenase
MHILILGAAGMLGRKLTQSLMTSPLWPVTQLTLADVVAPVPVPGAACLTVDMASPATAAALIAGRPEVIFHLAAIVSGDAEQNFDKGYTVNLDASRWLFEAIRAQPDYCPRVVFASSGAVFGPPFAEVLADDVALTPRTSYGTQKAITELLLADYSRRGMLDGIGLRLPTICIRPGLPNLAASGFFSNILREPLVGKPAVLPVRDSLRHWFASPRAAIGFLRHAAVVDTYGMDQRRSLNMPGLSATVAEEIEALRRVAGQKAVDLIRVAPDAAIAKIVEGWAAGFDPVRARSMGFTADASFDDIISAHIADELGGVIA